MVISALWNDKFPIINLSWMTVEEATVKETCFLCEWAAAIDRKLSSEIEIQKYIKSFSCFACSFIDFAVHLKLFSDLAYNNRLDTFLRVSSKIFRKNQLDHSWVPLILSLITIAFHTICSFLTIIKLSCIFFKI